MRSDKLTKLRIEWRDSRFFLGKNKVIALALGKTPEAEIADGISQLSSELKGEVGLLFTNESKKTVSLFFYLFNGIIFYKFIMKNYY